MSTQLPTIVSVNISDGGIPKTAVQTAQVIAGGLAGDGHDHDKHDTPVQAISILDLEDIDDLRAEGFDVTPGSTGENLTVQDLQADKLEIGDRLVFSGAVELEITKRRKPCYVLDAIDPELKIAIQDRCGCYAKVLVPGTVQAGETIEVVRSSK